MQSLLNPKFLVYTQKIVDQAKADNLKSLVKLRHELVDEDLQPLPFYYAEKMVFLGSSLNMNYHQTLCEHGKFILNYYDVFKPKKYFNLVYPNEYQAIDSSRTLRPEREQLADGVYNMNKLLLGTTMLPRSVVEYIYDEYSYGKMLKEYVAAVWKAPKCRDCVEKYGSIRKRRVVERYLFLKYQTKKSKMDALKVPLQISISRVWAHAWVEYMFYDTELFYSILQNKNYELPNPPVDYTFVSGPNDSMMTINYFHAVVIKAFYSSHKEVVPGILLAKDTEVLRSAARNQLDEMTLQVIERQAKKMILEIIQDPSEWMMWLNLFEEENIYEETVPSESRKETAVNQSNTVKEISSIHNIHSFKYDEISNNFKKDLSSLLLTRQPLQQPPVQPGHPRDRLRGARNGRDQAR